MKNGNTVTTMLDRAIDELSPEVAFALGCANHCIDDKDPEARLLVQEELARVGAGGYTFLQHIGEAVQERLRERVKALVPEEPLPPVIDEGDADEPPPAPSMLPCVECGKPETYLPGSKDTSCSDCRALKGVDVQPPGVTPEQDVGF